MPITAECTDPLYHHFPVPQGLGQVGVPPNQPYKIADEMRTSPVPHRYVNGGFQGTNARFSFYFPPADQYQGRFFQSTFPLAATENESNANIAFSIASGGYAVHTNQGGADGSMSEEDTLIRHKDPSITSYRANAAAAKLSRLMAEQMYGPHRPFGYIYGGSGGSYQTISSMENTIGVWDGAVPFVIPTPNSIPSYMTVEVYALRILNGTSPPGVFPQIADAISPGGSGDPFAGLNAQQHAALLEATLLGFPLRAWWDYPMLNGGALPLVAAAVPILDPTYVDSAGGVHDGLGDFWTKPGYEGTDPTSSIGDLRVRFSTSVNSLKVSSTGVVTGLVLASVPTKDVTGAYLVFTTGAAVGQLIPLGTLNTTTNTVTFGFGTDPAVVSEIKIGDQLTIDNSWYLALQTYHRHQIPPPDLNLYGWDQFRNPDGSPKYPQREVLIGPVGSASATGDGSGAVQGPGAIETGLFHGKMIVLGSLMDDQAFPWSCDWYRKTAQAARGGDRDDRRGDLEDSFRLWFTDNADHTAPPNLATRAVEVSYQGVLEQALRDVSAWVEKGVRPPASTRYQVVDTQIQVPASAEQRKGIQPVVNLTANGGVRAEVAVGQSVTFSADADVPPNTGQIVKAEWDFMDPVQDVAGLGTYPVTENIDIGSSVHLAQTHTYSLAGTYFPVVRVTSQRQGDPTAPYGKIQNVARARVVVR
jgi:hypothetical protein